MHVVFATVMTARAQVVLMQRLATSIQRRQLTTVLVNLSHVQAALIQRLATSIQRRQLTTVLVNLSHVVRLVLH